ncbi:MAG TPA: hypothetical protein DIW17_06840, partial [Clostridiales bacterium]|nr:hypothetical protein [Clostridiales bacterium]
MKKRIALLIVAVMLFSLPVTSLAAETTKDIHVPKAGITPDSWLYGLDNFMKELHLLVTFNVADKAGLLDDISGERLAEALKMVEENKGEYALTAMKEYKSALEDIVEVLDKAILDEKDMRSVIDKINSNRLDRKELIDVILGNMSDEIRSEIEKSLSAAKDELEITIEVTDLEEDDDDLQDSNNADDNEDSGDKSEVIDDESDAEAKDESKKDEKSTVEDIDSEEGEVELPLKKVVTAKILEETIGVDTAQKFVLGELNLRQILAVSSLAEQTEKTFEEVLTVFLENEKGIGATAKALGLHPKDALKEIKKVFKGTKSQIKADFAEAKQEVKAGIVNESPEENLGEDKQIADNKDNSSDKDDDDDDDDDKYYDDDKDDD